MNTKDKFGVIGLLILNEQTRQYIVDLLERNHYAVLSVSDPQDILGPSPHKPAAIFFIDWEAINIYGLGLISQIISCRRSSRIIYLYDKDHRDDIRRIMDLGVYACIKAPYEEWEILTMVRHILTKKPPTPPASTKSHLLPSNNS